MPRRISLSPELATVDILSEQITISDSLGEIVMWDNQEWHDDPTIVPAIANAVRIGLTQGAAALRDLLLPGGPSSSNPPEPVSDTQHCTVCDLAVRLPERREHLVLHNSDAANMTTDEVISMYTGIEF